MFVVYFGVKTFRAFGRIHRMGLASPTFTLSDFFSSWGSLDQSGLPKHIGQLTFLFVTASWVYVPGLYHKTNNSQLSSVQLHYKLCLSHPGLSSVIHDLLLNLCVVELKGVFAGGGTLDWLWSCWYCCGEGVAVWWWEKSNYLELDMLKGYSSDLVVHFHKVMARFKK